MSQACDELVDLIAVLPEAEVSTLLSTAGALGCQKVDTDRTWPPAFFGNIKHAANGRTGNVRRADEVLAEAGFGQGSR